MLTRREGVGKSAVATLLAQYLAREGRRVLAIDLDHQANFSDALRRSGRCVLAATTADQVLEGAATAPAGAFVLIPSGPGLLTLERQQARHTPFAQALRGFMAQASTAFDTCVIDTNPNPDIRLIAALASCDEVLSPVQLNQEALDGVGFLLTDRRVGLQKIKAVLNPKLRFLGLLPTLVEPTPFQRANFTLVAQKYGHLLIRLDSDPERLASIPKRSVIAEAQASGELLWTMKKTAARDAWKEIEPVVACIARALDAAPGAPAYTAVDIDPRTTTAAAAP